MKSKAAVAATVVVAALVYVQLILGGGVLLSGVGSSWGTEGWRESHIGLGHGIWFVAIVPAVLLWRLKPPSRTLRIGGITLVVLAFIQANLGTQGPWGSIPVMTAHGLTAGLVFATAVSLTVLAAKE